MVKIDQDYVQELEDKVSKLEADVEEKVIENHSTRHSGDGRWVYRSDIITHRNRLQRTLEEFEVEQENLNARLEQNQSRIFGVQGALTSILALLGEGQNPFDAPDEIQNLLDRDIIKESRGGLLDIVQDQLSEAIAKGEAEVSIGKELDGNTIEVDNEEGEVL